MHRLSRDVKQENIILFHRHIPLLTSGETLSGKKKYVPSPLRGCVGHYHEFAALLVVSQTHAFFYKIMVNNINNFGVINFYESNSANAHSESKQVEDITPISPSVTSEFDSDISDSIIFTKKAKQENKIPAIVQALQKSLVGRKDKTRALVKELQYWQKDDYIDPNYNAQVMYDELQKIMRLPFGYDAFKRLYNNTRS